MPSDEYTIHEEIKIIEKILEKYMSREDILRLTFHLLNVIREVAKS